MDGFFHYLQIFQWYIGCMDKRERGGRQREDEICGVVDLSLIFLGLRSPWNICLDLKLGFQIYA